VARRRPQISKVDSNHASIVNELRGARLSVQSLAKVADGCPDICVGYAGVNLLFEIKTMEERTATGALKKTPKMEALTPMEVEWHESWLGQVATVWNSRQVIEVMEKELLRLGIRHLTPEALTLLLF
jgi:hypothetical protein